MGLYLDSGYLNWDYILSKGMAFNFVIGGRGIGKTYGILKKLAETGEISMLLRRLQSQIDIITSDLYNPYKAINADMGLDVYLKYHSEGKNLVGLYWTSDIDEGGKIKQVKVSPLLGYAGALSTIKNIRGFSGEDIRYLLFDEFIGEEHEKNLKFEGRAFLNAYETINRNRELKGEKPLTAILMANANNLASPILLEFNLVSTITKLIKNGNEEYIDKNRGIGLWLIKSSPISAEKRNTALYKIAGEDFSSMALDSMFVTNYSIGICARPLKEYKPLASIGELVIYKHKSNNMYYITTHKSGSPPHYPMTQEGCKLFLHDFSFLRIVNIQGRIEYENEICKILLTNLGL